MDPIFILLRLLVPLIIFRFPLIGGLVSLLLDGADWHANFFYIDDLHTHYRQIDKYLDFYYYSIELYTVLSWTKGWAKKAAIGLYIWRSIGTFLFVWTQGTFLPVIFPNIFEGFFLLYLCCWTLLRKEPRFSKGLVLGSIIVLAIPRVFQEYVMHVTNPWDWRYVHLVLPNGFTFVYDNIYHQMVIGVILLLTVYVFLRAQKNKLKQKRGA